MIEAARGSDTFSTWVREACARRLEAEAGLGPQMRADLNVLTAQLRGLGINLNQLTRAAHEGRPVVVNPVLLDDILRTIRGTRDILNAVRERLPE